jgi:hypothetical protein
MLSCLKIGYTEKKRNSKVAIFSFIVGSPIWLQQGLWLQQGCGVILANAI